MNAVHAPEVARPTLVDPTTLVLGENVRRTVVLDTAFKRDVAARGVRQPVEVRRDPMDQLVVIDGQRRTLAAIEAGVQVPVFVVDDIADEADRIVEQLGANGHRASISKADHVAAVQQLVLFGLSNAAIAKRTQLPKEEVAAARALAEADEETRGAVLAEGVDLVVAAKVADAAAGDTETIERLTQVARSRPAAIDHELEHARRERAEREAVENRVRELRAQGVTVLDTYPETYARGAKAEHLRELTDKPNAHGTAPRIAATEHQMSCPGHAVYVRAFGVDRLDETTFCTDWREHGHFKRSARNTAGATSGAEPEDATAHRRLVIANGKAAEAAETVRRQWIREHLLTASSKPNDAAMQHAALMIAIGRPDDFGVGQALDDLLGQTQASRVEHIRRSPADGKRYLLALALAIGERDVIAKGDAAFWRRPPSSTWPAGPSRGAEHLRFLAAGGYGLSEIEQTWLDSAEKAA
ncbi:ParB/RepB/Spo0J family partition protein [Isoptericola variabilis]|uniref:ParB/RepB/Spo0J family partition protein n=1 Tax=Isoptericola variabilis TaxID=139208 RepID=UPI003D1A5150